MGHHRIRTEDLMLTRRDALRRGGMGFGALALGTIMGEQGLLAPNLAMGETTEGGVGISPMAPKAPQFPGKAKRVVHLFMNGGPSHVDTFDPKPQLTRFHGKPVPSNRPTERRTGAAFASPFKFKKY